jgi:hypothetical protein
MSYHLNTKRGYSFPAVSSAMQKAIRRGDAKLAGYWALELWTSGFGQYVWRRLLTVSAEDCWGILTQEVKALHDSYTEINRNTPSKTPKGRKRVSFFCVHDLLSISRAPSACLAFRASRSSSASEYPRL